MPHPQGAATANRPKIGATAWSSGGDATSSTVHVRERNSRYFFAYAGSTRRNDLHDQQLADPVPLATRARSEPIDC
jgi:hypothetical protein